MHLFLQTLAVASVTAVLMAIFMALSKAPRSPDGKPPGMWLLPLSALVNAVLFATAVWQSRPYNGAVVRSFFTVGAFFVGAMSLAMIASLLLRLAEAVLHSRSRKS